MTLEETNKLYIMLDKLAAEKQETCDYDCHNCDYGMLIGYCDGFNCSIEFVRDTMIGEKQNDF